MFNPCFTPVRYLCTMNLTIKVVLNTQKTYANDEHPIRIRITKDRKTNYISLGLKCSEKLWDHSTGLPKRKHPLYLEYSLAIRKKVADIEKQILQAEIEEQNLSSKEIVQSIKVASTRNETVYEYFDEVIERLKRSGSIKNSAVYRDTRNNLKNFHANTLYFSQVNYAFVKKWEEFLKEAGKGGNTIYIYLRTFRALINRAIKEKVCKESYYPFKDFSMSDYKKIKTRKRALDKTDIYKIRDFDTTLFPALTDAKNIFLFSYYCRGMNFIDICQLKYSNIDGEQLSYTRQKTDGFFNMKILPPALAIIEYYRPITFKNNDSFIFPIFNENYTSKLSQHNRHVKMLTHINKQLKTLGQKCQIEKELTTYVARHTYATVMKKSGNSVGAISESMGHSSEKVTQIYLDSFENSYLDEANKAIL